MTELTDKDRIAELSIRGKPAPVRRFSKKALMIILGGASALVLGTFALAMKSPDRDGARTSAELYSTGANPQADGLASLPVSYRDLKPEAPVLGPALPGDLGAPLLQAHREGRINLDEMIDPLPEETPDDVAAREAAAARTLAARESGLFFSKTAQAAAQVQQVISRTGIDRDPFDALSLIDQLSPGGPGFHDANFQSRKQDFVAEGSSRGVYNPYQIETPRSPWQVMAGTVIPASLITAINSDLPGQAVAQVTEPIYDTITGETLLIPQGSRMLGRYDSVIAYGQSRALIVWSRIIMPDGTSIQIENLPAVDGRGNAGLKDKVNHHAWRLFSAAALSSLISIGAELSEDGDDEIARALRDAGQDGASRVGEEVVRRQLQVQPTLTIRPGWRFRILVHQDIILRPYGAS